MKTTGKLTDLLFHLKQNKQIDTDNKILVITE